MLCDHLEGWDRRSGRETQEGDGGIWGYEDKAITQVLQQFHEGRRCRVLLLLSCFQKRGRTVYHAPEIPGCSVVGSIVSCVSRVS